VSGIGRVRPAPVRADVGDARLDDDGLDPDAPIPRAVWRLALVIVFGAFMSGLDASVVNVGLDSVAHDLGTTLDDVQWVSSAYLIAFGVSLPVCGWLGRRLGVGRLWLGALAGFTVSSALCAAAPRVEALVAARVLQGATAGLLIPAGQTILGQAVGPHRLGRVMATLGIAVSLAPALGPLVGGVTLDLGPWPWLFLLNIPLGVAGLLLGLRLVPRGTRGTAPPLDRLGLALLTVGLPLVVYGVTTWGERRQLLTPSVLVPVVAGAVALLGYGLHARGRADAVLDLRLFRRPAYAAACATAACTGAALFGAGLLLPLYFQLGRGQTPLASGVSLIALSIGTAVALPWSGRLVDRHGGGITSVVGGLATVATTVPFAVLPVDVPGTVVQLLLVVRGMAIALAVVPAGTAAYKAVTRDQLPDATTQVNIVQRLGGALGGSLCAVLVATRLPDGVDAAFHSAFWLLTGASALGVVAALGLTRIERGSEREGAVG
jgi:EmrB/QacA subfamily drug resistance transporter